jgi:hypothetical protein
MYVSLANLFTKSCCHAHDKFELADAPIPSAPPQGLPYSLTQEDIDTYLKAMYTRTWGVKWNNRQL